MKFSLTTPKPRNPVALAARQRSAGSHRPSTGSQRQRHQQALRQALQHERHPPT